MRIIAGKYRRRKLQTNPGLVTRPITDRAKEPLFERLGQRLSEARVADVFAGTGTLGMESLSRGAASVVFIEQDRKAIEFLKRNIAAIGVADQSLCWRTDAVRCSYRPQGVPAFVPFDLIFFDPPYKMMETLKPRSPLFQSLERLGRSTVSAADAMLCLRTPARAEFEIPHVWQPVRTLDLSSMAVHLFERAQALEDVSELHSSDESRRGG